MGVLKPSVLGAKLWVVVACVRGHCGAARGLEKQEGLGGGTPTDPVRVVLGGVVLKAWLGVERGGGQGWGLGAPGVRSLAVRGVDFFVVASFLIVTLMTQEGQSCVGPVATSSLNQGPNPDSHPEQGAGGLRTWVPKAQEHHVQSSWEVWGLSLTRPQSVQGQWERCVQTLSHPLPRPPPWAVLSTGTRGPSGSSSPEGLQGLLSYPGAFISQTGPGISSPAQLRACFDFYLQFYGRTPGALWAAGHPCYDDRQCIFHERVSVRLVGMK